MEVSLFKYLKKLDQSGDVLSFMDYSNFDEMLEIDANRDWYRVVYHLEEKYYLPSSEGKYTDFVQYSLDYLIHPDDREEYQSLMMPEVLRERLAASSLPGVVELVMRIRTLDGNWRWVGQILLGDAVKGVPKGKILCYIIDAQNIQDRKDGISRLGRSRRMAKDSLTGLSQRQDFLEQAGDILSAGPSGWILIVIDLEKFKLFNDWYGWEAGNMVLARIGAGLRRDARRGKGIAGYMGNDDFVLLVPQDSIDVQRLFESIHRVVTRYGVSVGFLPSFGITRAEEGISVRNLMDQASLACDFAKKDFKRRIRWFEKDMQEGTEREYLLLSDFQNAIRNNEIYFVLQPQVRASTGEIVGAEALARWKKADGNVIPPFRFIPVLEKSGFVTDLDQYVWDSVAAWIRSWLDRGMPLVPVSINVSQVDIYTIDVPGVLAKLVKKYRLPQNALKVEITESACAEGAGTVRDCVRKLREEGFLVLMDDFGSGYSSLNMLHELEVDVIKLDARFLNMDVKTEKKGINILESIVNMTKMMGLPIVVEGVETKEQLDFLRDLGCSYVQGYYFYRPVPRDEFEKLAGRRNAVDTGGFQFKYNEEFRVREFMDQSIYSDAMLNKILGPVAVFSWHGDEIDIIRFNEQFYDAVGVRDIHERALDIQKYMPGDDAKQLEATLRAAMDDLFNGAEALLNFENPDGSFSRFLLRLFYLGEEGNSRRFYCSARNVTSFTALQAQMELISRYFSGCLIFISDRNGKYSYRVAAQGIEQLGLGRKELEERLNAGTFKDMISPEYLRTLERQSRDAAEGIDFSCYFSVYNTRGRRVNLYMKTEYVDDIGSDVKSLIVITGRQGE